MAVDYTTYLNPKYNADKAAAWNDRFAGVGGMQNPYGRTLSMPSDTITNMIRSLGGYQTAALTASQQKLYEGFKDPNKLNGPGGAHCFQSIDYNPDTRLARYQFANGLRNYYKMIGPYKAAEWSRADSLGNWYNHNIRMRMNNTPLGRLFYKR